MAFFVILCEVRQFYSVSFEEELSVCSIASYAFFKYFAAKSLPPSPKARPNARDKPPRINVNAEATIEFAMPNCVKAINPAKARMAYLANAAKTRTGGPLSIL